MARRGVFCIKNANKSVDLLLFGIFFITLWAICTTNLKYRHITSKNNFMPNNFLFSGHESFPCKSLWLKKGYDFIVHDKDFNASDAVIDLGVGKNMVASIRHWLRAFGILKDDKLTELGIYLFDDIKGKDKYLEDLATLWLLHFCLVFNDVATLYNMFFCGVQKERTNFDKDQVVTYVKLKMVEAGKAGSFNATFSDMELTECKWEKEVFN